MDRLTTAELTSCYRAFPVPPVCLALAHGTRLCVVRVDHARRLQRDVLPTLQAHSPGFERDLVLMNVG